MARCPWHVPSHRTPTRSIIESEKENIERLADLLLEKETIFAEDVEQILGKSAQDIAKAETEHSTEAENIEDSTEIKYIIEPSQEESNEKME